MATSEEVRNVLGLLCAAYPRFELLDATTALWTKVFAKMPATHLEAVVWEHLLTPKYFPNVGEIYSPALTAWNRATEEARSRVVKLDEPPPNPNDPVTLAGRAILAQAMRGIKRMDESGPADEATRAARAAEVARGEDES